MACIAIAYVVMAHIVMAVCTRMKVSWRTHAHMSIHHMQAYAWVSVHMSNAHVHTYACAGGHMDMCVEMCMGMCMDTCIRHV